jgi:hypothetical protein
MINGTWDGMIGMIIRGVKLLINSVKISILKLIVQEVDMSATELSITHIRYQDIDFTAPFYQESTAILIPPATEDTRILACLRPFTVEVTFS